MTIRIEYLIWILFLLLKIDAYGQNPAESKNQATEQEIDQDGLPLPRFHKSYLKPQITPLVIPPEEPYPFDLSESEQYRAQPLQLTILEPRNNLEKDTRKIIIEKFWQFSVKASGGNYFNASIESFLHRQQSVKYNYGIQLKHGSSQLGPVGKDQYSAYSENHVFAYTQYFFSKAVFTSHYIYDRTVRRFYGYTFDDANPNQSDTLKRIFQNFGFEMRLKTSNTASKKKYDYQFQSYQWIHNASTQERMFALNGKNDLVFSNQIHLQADWKAQAFQLKNASEPLRNRYLLQLKPVLHYDTDNISIDAGLNMYLNNDTTKTTNAFNIFPALNFDYKISDLFTVMIGLDGNLEQNTLKSIHKEQPLLRIDSPVINTIQNFHTWLQFQGEILPNLRYETMFSLANYDNFYFYNNILSDSAKFNIQYQNSNTQVMKWRFELNYTIEDWLRIKAQFNTYNYGLKNLKAPLNRPTWDFQILTDYYFSSRLQIQANLYAMGGIQYLRKKDNIEIIDQLNPIFDVSLQAEYLLSKNFYTFLGLQNILDRTNQQYWLYPKQGFNFLIGLRYVLR